MRWLKSEVKKWTIGKGLGFPLALGENVKF